MRADFSPYLAGLCLAGFSGYSCCRPHWHGPWLRTRKRNRRLPEIGDAEIAVIVVRPDGLVDGKMVFPNQGQTFILGEKLDIARGMNRGVVQGSTLTIETAMGGTYRLNLVGGQLSGEYIRGNTYKVQVTFQRAT